MGMAAEGFACHKCGACCTIMSISSPIPGMPNGKPAFTKCIHLTDDNLCGLFGKTERPDICSRFQASPDVCGTNREEAITLIVSLELRTRSCT